LTGSYQVLSDSLPRAESGLNEAAVLHRGADEIGEQWVRIKGPAF
jgi:hypothetical protein